MIMKRVMHLVKLLKFNFLQYLSEQNFLAVLGGAVARAGHHT